MTVAAAPPAGPARVSPRRNTAAPDPRRAAHFQALLGRDAKAEGKRRAPLEERRRDAGDGAPEPGLPPPASGLGQPTPPPTFALAPHPEARPEAEVTAVAAAQLVESVQVGLDRAGRAEVRFDVTDGPLKGLEVRLLAGAGGVEASFVADDAATRRALAAPLEELRRTLAEQGITVARLEVAVRADVGGGQGSPRGHDAGAAPRPAALDGTSSCTAAAAGAAAGLPLRRPGSPTDWIA
jgi:hypothetical protein